MTALEEEFSGSGELEETRHLKAGVASPQLHSLELIKTPHAMRPIAVALIVLALLLALALVFTPWQQSITGYGRVIVFSPMDRPQNIEAQIPGRLVRWNIVEGQMVKAGEIIGEIEDIDSKFLDQDQLKRLKLQRDYMQSGLAETISRESALHGQFNDMEKSRNLAIPVAVQRKSQAEDRLRAAEQNLEQAQQAVATAELNLKRLQELYEKGLRSKRDLELAELDLVTAKTRLESQRAGLDVASKDLQVAELDKDRVVNDTSAQLRSLQASQASVRETIAKSNGDLQKLQVDIGNLAQRLDQRLIKATRDGRVVRVAAVGQGKTVKAGDLLAVLAPTTNDQAVELWLSGYDAPLASVGRPVRLNFAGWPAVQFVGWPSIAVGTFAGKIKVIDAIDDGKNRFRIIVEPDSEAIRSGKEVPWPTLNQLRPGAETNGWVMLDTVSLGFELWRQFNAFPPTVDRGPIGEKPKVQAGEGKSPAGQEEK